MFYQVGIGKPFWRFINQTVQLLTNQMKPNWVTRSNRGKLIKDLKIKNMGHLE